MDAQKDRNAKKWTKRRWRRVAAVFALIMAVGWGTSAWVGKTIVNQMDASLTKAGLVLERKSAGWGPVSGLRVTEPRLRHRDGTRMVDADAITVDFPYDQFFKKTALVTVWKTRHVNATFYDQDGGVSLQDVSVDLVARGGKVVVRSAKARKGGLIAEVNGVVLTKNRSPEDRRKPFTLRLDALRSTLAVLNVGEEGGDFRVKGRFTVDSRGSKVVWTAGLYGSGMNIDWLGIPARQATAKADLTEGNSVITADLLLPHGGGSISMDRVDWKGSPFQFRGTLQDEKGRADIFHGSYQGRERTLTVESLQGSADLWAMARDIPLLAGGLPEEVSFRTFPELRVEDLKRVEKADRVRWSVGNARIQGKGTLEINGREMEVSAVSGGASYDGEVWRLDEVQGTTMGGKVGISGRYQNGDLSDARITMESVRLSDLKELAKGKGSKSASAGRVFMDYRGDVSASARTLDGRGTVRLENAPVIETPLLDEVYDLFISLIPGVERSKSGEFHADFSGKGNVVSVNRFVAKGGSLTVTAEGTIQLKSQKVNGTARGNLAGAPGLLTSPLSHLLEMEVEGTLEKIRLKPQGPLKRVVNAVEDLKDRIKGDKSE